MHAFKNTHMFDINTYMHVHITKCIHICLDIFIYIFIYIMCTSDT